MAGYIGAKVGTVTGNAADIKGDITSTDTSPDLTLKNTTQEDSDGGRESTIHFKGEQSGGEESTLAEIRASHDGNSDDEKGDLIFKTNDGSDGASPTERLRIDSAGSIIPTTLGTNNTHLGEGAAASIASGGNNNTAIGYNSGNAISTGDKNTALGVGSYQSGTTASNNTALGYNALFANTTGTGHVAVGSLAADATTTGSYITALGFAALTSNTTGNRNTAVGPESLSANTTGVSNVAVGTYNDGGGVAALSANTTGNFNTAIGGSALGANTTASFNTALGYQAGFSNVTGDDQTFIGYKAGTNTTGTDNTFVGASSGGSVTSGSKNTILGKYNGNQGGIDIRTSSNNIILSDGDGNPRLYIDSTGCTAIGTISTTSDTISRFGGSSSKYSQKMVNSYGGGTAVYMDNSSNQSWIPMRFNTGGSQVGFILSSTSSTSYSTTSDYRLKENVTYDWDATTRLKQLKPSRFNFIANPDKTVDGFLAHEVSSIVPEAITGEKDAVDENGNIDPQGIDQAKLVPLLVKTIQELEARITALEG